MKIAEILSDLTSLRGSDEALALVTASSTVIPGSSSSQPSLSTSRVDNRNSPRLSDENDPDLRRARELLALYATVNSKHAQGFDPGLERASQDIGALIERLKGNGGAKGSSDVPVR
ncbi:hypothetical protein FGG08_002572 [Glutinoglossum americanum]|uniref:Uncharacterized protein n=1 Tax=Glutinoglossum americanum TaxID=1670608 RepID=A0A9P8L4D2_9PEZI|nr:hypothetical protein FGG08_002572 [Glutinoglossum americanum]